MTQATVCNQTKSVFIVISISLLLSACGGGGGDGATSGGGSVEANQSAAVENQESSTESGDPTENTVASIADGGGGGGDGNSGGAGGGDGAGGGAGGGGAGAGEGSGLCKSNITLSPEITLSNIPPVQPESLADESAFGDTETCDDSSAPKL